MRIQQDKYRAHQGTVGDKLQLGGRYNFVVHVH